MPRVAIIGSCITRDLWPTGGDAPDSLLYISRTSIPSLFAPAVADFEEDLAPPGPLRPAQHAALVSDLHKRALSRLVDHQPTHLIFDLVDERFDLLNVAGTLVTHSWELEVSGYLDLACFNPRRTIDRLSPACDRLWHGAVHELRSLIESTPLRSAQVILHAAQWAGRWAGPDGTSRELAEESEILGGRPATRREHNALLERYQRTFLDLMPGSRVVSAPDLRIADPNHRWGLSPFHYVPDYYRLIRNQLHDLGV